MTSASAAIEKVIDLLQLANVDPTREASGFTPNPVGVLVGLPGKIRATLAGETFEVPVYVVSGEPVNTSDAVDRLYSIADACAHALSESRYTTTTWAGSGRVAPLAAIEIVATVTVSNDPQEV